MHCKLAPFTNCGRMMTPASSMSCRLVLLLVLVIVDYLHLGIRTCQAGVTSRYMRILEDYAEDLPFDSPYLAAPPGYNAPQQVHIAQGDQLGEAVIVSWVTPSEPGKSEVYYGTSKGQYEKTATGKYTQYKAFNYVSGFIHHVTIRNLKHSTRYYYKLGEGKTAREFWFKTPPKVGPDVPYVFGVIGDLGQTPDSLQTLLNYHEKEGEAVLYVGDLSYADEHPNFDPVKWDTFGRLVERSTAYHPWILAAGNHEVEYGPEIGVVETFTAFTHRYRTPYKAANSSSNLWYSVKRGPAHIIVLSSYSPYVKYTPQYIWLQAELEKVDRSLTPWLIIVLHAPLYNSNEAHQLEAEGFRLIFEPWFVKYKVDVVYAGHVHAYERTYKYSNIRYSLSNPVVTPIPDESAPVYIVIGDGGNLENAAKTFVEPQPEFSAFREGSFGYGYLDIKNKTHAYFTWHRNGDGTEVVADDVWLVNNYWGPRL